MSWTVWPDFLKARYALAKSSEATLMGSSYEYATDNPLAAKDAIDWAYAVLTTLDAKASALMRLNGVLIAAAAFMLGLFRRTGGTILSTTKYDATLIVSAAFLSAVSIFCCLFVVNVSWKFLGEVKANGALYTFEAEIRRLYKAISFRQRAYRIAWFISLVAAAAFLVEFAWQTAYIVYCEMLA